MSAYCYSERMAPMLLKAAWINFNNLSYCRVFHLVCDCHICPMIYVFVFRIYNRRVAFYRDKIVIIYYVQSFLI